MAQLSAAIDAFPAAFSGNPLHLFFLEDAKAIASAEQYLRGLDGPALIEERREYLPRSYGPWPFPAIGVPGRPDPWQLSLRLFDRLEDVEVILPSQRAVAGIVEARVRQVRPDVVVLVIADGLSYYDLPDDMDARPCFVAGVSNTEFGYREVVGNPSLARRLFTLGYQDQRGYTYYAVEEESLSGAIFGSFSPTQVRRVSGFEEIIGDVSKASAYRAYIQVTLAGLDQLCHFHRDRPPREHYLHQLLHRFEQLTDCLVSKGYRAVACLTADHGILWREYIENRCEIISDLFSEDARSPRYVKGHILRPYGRTRTCSAGRFTLLGAPFLTRRLKATEWGVHGGISAWESLVPLRIITVG